MNTLNSKLVIAIRHTPGANTSDDDEGGCGVDYKRICLEIIEKTENGETFAYHVPLHYAICLGNEGIRILKSVLRQIGFKVVVSFANHHHDRVCTYYGCSLKKEPILTLQYISDENYERFHQTIQMLENHSFDQWHYSVYGTFHVPGKHLMGRNHCFLVASSQ